MPFIESAPVPPMIVSVALPPTRVSFPVPPPSRLLMFVEFTTWSAWSPDVTLISVTPPAWQTAV
jgi:hypothetical protein